MGLAHKNFQKMQLQVDKYEKKDTFLLKMKNVATHISMPK